VIGSSQEKKGGEKEGREEGTSLKMKGEDEDEDK